MAATGTATVADAIAEQRTEKLVTALRAAWSEYQPAEKKGLAFGQRLYKLREGSEVVQGGTTFAASLDAAEIPRRTAYYWLHNYEVSIGIKVPLTPSLTLSQKAGEALRFVESGWDKKKACTEAGVDPRYLARFQKIKEWGDEHGKDFTTDIQNGELSIGSTERRIEYWDNSPITTKVLEDVTAKHVITSWASLIPKHILVEAHKKAAVWLQGEKAEREAGLWKRLSKEYTFNEDKGSARKRKKFPSKGKMKTHLHKKHPATKAEARALIIQQGATPEEADYIEKRYAEEEELGLLTPLKRPAKKQH